MEVIENHPEVFQDFVRLNEEWISRYFQLEEVDRELARNPQMVIDDGGYIFSLEEDGEVLGVCALFFEESGVYELARMAVSPIHQGNGYAHILMRAAIRKLEALGAKRVYLVSNTKLKAAISLYKKYGFHTIFEGRHPVYSRANIVMERLMHNQALH
ncbi:MAG: GNAT family N-acetyltransferase [Verrucomicrobiota bacterium]